MTRPRTGSRPSRAGPIGCGRIPDPASRGHPLPANIPTSMAMHELRISVDVRPGAAVVAVVGDVSAVNIDPFRKGLADAIARKQPRTVVDLSQTTFLSSPGLAVLVQGLQLSQRGGSQLYLAAANDRVRGIFEIARLTEVFRMVPTVDAALEA
ncbi:MAG: STAS domain-containing protein [Planctomycetes bacterium]|nr:STAS domain-containing protein [Planctomycetota bacterium]